MVAGTQATISDPEPIEVDWDEEMEEEEAWDVDWNPALKVLKIVADLGLDKYLNMPRDKAIAAVEKKFKNDPSKKAKAIKALTTMNKGMRKVEDKGWDVLRAVPLRNNPIREKNDDQGSYFQWGKQKKYYFNENNNTSRQAAYDRAKAQVAAIFASGYRPRKNARGKKVKHEQELKWYDEVDWKVDHHFIYGYYHDELFQEGSGLEITITPTAKDKYSIAIMFEGKTAWEAAHNSYEAEKAEEKQNWVMDNIPGFDRDMYDRFEGYGSNVTRASSQYIRRRATGVHFGSGPSGIWISNLDWAECRRLFYKNMCERRAHLDKMNEEGGVPHGPTKGEQFLFKPTIWAGDEDSSVNSRR